MTRLERLEAFARRYAQCPCCEELEKCLPECTFAADCPAEAERMEWARKALANDRMKSDT